MDCEILRTLYVKANGEILCNDDFGEQVVLGVPDYDRDDTGIHRILIGDRYRHIHASFQAGRLPWPGICEHCALLRPREPWSGDLLAARVIERIQFEPSLACALKCPSCCNRAQVRARRPPLHFPLAWMARLLADLAAHGYRIQTIELCGQGEPLNHPAFAELLRVVRGACPGARLRLVTNGNHDYDAKIGDHFIEETIVSIDGATQASYQRYRVKGRIARALDFLRRSALRQIPAGGSVVWKYILLTSNDSDAEIVEAQRMAAEIGVSRIWFVHGHGAMRSARYGYASSATIPIAYPRVKVAAHPSYNRDSRSFNDPGGAELVAGPAGAVWLDTLVVQPNRMLALSGWAGSVRPDLLGLALGIDAHASVAIPLDIARPDVRAVHPLFRQEICGFDLLVPDPRADPADTIDLDFTLSYRGATRSILRKRIALA